MPKAKERKADAARLRQWLKACGHPAQAVDSARLSSQAEIVAAVCELCGVTAHEYERARGSMGRDAQEIWRDARR